MLALHPGDGPAERRERIHPLTTRMYDALEHELKIDPKFPRRLDPREVAVAIHLAALGFVTMAGELEGANDSMKLPMARYADALAAALAMGIGG
jgi:integrase